MSKVNEFDSVSSRLESVMKLSYGFEESDEEPVKTKKVKKSKKPLLKENLEDINSECTSLVETKKVKKLNKQVTFSLTENNTFEIYLPSNKFKINIADGNYNVYTNNSESFISVVQDNLKLFYKKFSLELRKNKENNTYSVFTNQSIKLDSVVKVSNLSKEKSLVSFDAENLNTLFLEKRFLHLESSEESKKTSELEDSNELIISEKDEKVFLPYKLEEVRKEYALSEENYSSLNDVIEKKYTIPMSFYKNSIVSRYREAYNLMRNKEHKSIKDSFLLGVELMFEFNLHPAIITACKNLEELDIYLDCLDDNELNKFSCFSIIYKSLPVLSHKKNLQPNNI